jgi:ABC-type antimicrobial peptide transport system permease subunit
MLAAIGLYGVISYTVEQRTNEIGIRMALGALRSDVIRLIFGEVSLLLGIGIAIGVGLTLAGGRATGSLLFGLKAHDPLTLALTVILLAVIGLVASFLPARLASPRSHGGVTIRVKWGPGANRAGGSVAGKPC